MTRLSTHFTLAELTLSQTASRKGLTNTPDDQAIACLRDLVKHILEPLRLHLDRPVVVTSGFRSKGVDEAIGGADSSQHCLGQAADIHVPGMAVADLAKVIRRLNLPFDQLIDEFGSWVHVSYGPKHRRESFLARKVDSKTIYTKMEET